MDNHIRIRPFNTRDTYPEQNLDTDLAQAVVAGGVLDEAGSKLQDIVKVTVYLIDIRYREPVYQVMGRWLKGVHPVSTGLVVSALARPEWLVEIDATAVISDSGGTA
jgi:enamine deaminase RidA (YjgF/YER057c/UK114 family)